MVTRIVVKLNAVDTRVLALFTTAYTASWPETVVLSFLCVMRHHRGWHPSGSILL